MASEHALCPVKATDIYLLAVCNCYLVVLTAFQQIPLGFPDIKSNLQIVPLYLFSSHFFRLIS